MSDSANDDEENWTLVIQPKRKWLDINLREIIRYRDLVWLFVKRDFVTVYKQMILGPLWFVLKSPFSATGARCMSMKPVGTRSIGGAYDTFHRGNYKG